MPPQISQPPHPGMPPNDAAASLAMATHISTQLATPQQPQGTPQGAETPLQTMQDTHAPDIGLQVEELQKQVADLTKKVANDQQDDIKEMRQMIEQALGEEDTTENGK